MIFWFFGPPGTGKDYCAKTFSEISGAQYIHADDLLTDKEKERIIEGTFTDQDRILKIKRIVKVLKKTQKETAHIAIADSLPSNASRILLHTQLPGKITLILVKTPKKLHQKRLKNRKDHFFEHHLLKSYLEKHWEPVTIPHYLIKNDVPIGTLRKNLKAIWLLESKNRTSHSS